MMDLTGLRGGTEQRPRSPHGALCCSEEQHQKNCAAAAQSRKKTPEQRRAEKKLKKAAVKRTQQLSKTKKDTILNKWGNKCAITGFTDPLEVHHMYSEAHYPQLGNESKNCIVLHATIHSQFHGLLYDMKRGERMPTTAQNFIDFVESLRIMHTNCLLEIEKGLRDLPPAGAIVDPAGLDFSKQILKNIEILLPKLKEFNLELKEML